MRVRRFVSMLNPWRALDAARRDAERRADFAALFATTRGRRVLSDIINEGGVFRAHLRFDDRSLAVLEGRRSLALDIFDLAGGARARLGQAMTRDDLGEALDEPDPARPDDDAGRAGDTADDAPGVDGVPLFAAAERNTPILDDGDPA